MKVSIDFSIYTQEGGAFGNVSGDIDVSIFPQIGDSISFLFSRRNIAIEPSIGFGGVLKVTDRIIPADRDDQLLMLVLSDVVLSKNDDAIKLVGYFESAFDLFSVAYSD